jgi:IclR family transcriptional regulator, acetate operon repressor
VDKYSVPSLARAFEILDMLAMSSVGLNKMEIARGIKIPYSTAFNLLNTMESHGYVRKDDGTGKYYIGLKLLSLGSIPLNDIGLRDTASPVLEELVRQTGLTAHLAILDRGEAVYIDRKESAGYVKINSWIGKRNFVHTSAVGKALIAYRPPEEIEKIWKQGLPKRTGHTITALKRLKAELSEVIHLGYAVDREEDELGGRCVAAPIFGATGGVIAAVGISGIASQVPDERLPKLGELIRSRAMEISRRLGWSERPRDQPSGGYAALQARKTHYGAIQSGRR